MTITEDVYTLHAELCKAFTNPVRLHILDELRDDERSVSQLCDRLSISQSGISQHLNVLHKAGVVKARRSGNITYYSLRDKRLLQAFDSMRKMLVDVLMERNSVLLEREVEHQ
jgi:ArsR family transcriptional regulator